MIRRLFVILALLSSAAFAQTTYDIPDNTPIDYIFYGTYTNTFFPTYSLTVGGVSYSVSGVMHFTEGNPSATYGSITFTNYTPTGSTSVTENLTNINYNPFTFLNATATADFAGQFNGSLTFNIKRVGTPRYGRDILTTVNGTHSNYTLQ